MIATSTTVRFDCDKCGEEQVILACLTEALTPGEHEALTAYLKAVHESRCQLPPVEWPPTPVRLDEQTEER